MLRTGQGRRCKGWGIRPNLLELGGQCETASNVGITQMMVKKSKRRARALNREEWFLLDVDKDEKRAAFVYEHGRELTRRGLFTIDSIFRLRNPLLVRVRPRGRIDYQKLMRDHLPDFVRIAKDRFPHT